MRSRALFFAACVLTASLASAQWLEKTIPVPDSFVWQRGPQCVAYATVTNTIYVGSQANHQVTTIWGFSSSTGTASTPELKNACRLPPTD